MKKEVRLVQDGIYQITTLDERWYSRNTINKTTGLPEIEYVPSSTWISSYYPKGVQFYKWLASKGWDEAEAIKISAGKKGSKVHQACQVIDEGKEISLETGFINPETGEIEELSLEEILCISSFCKWTDKVVPELLANELTGFGNGYAGTIDKIYRIPKNDFKISEGIWIVDIKTGQSIWEEQVLQISSYKYLDINIEELGITEKEWADRRLATLQVGYNKNKNGYKFTEVEDKYNLFIGVAHKIWQNENPNATPKQRDFPLTLKSEVRQKENKNESESNESVK